MFENWPPTKVEVATALIALVWGAFCLATFVKFCLWLWGQ